MFRFGKHLLSSIHLLLAGILLVKHGSRSPSSSRLKRREFSDSARSESGQHSSFPEQAEISYPEFGPNHIDQTNHYSWLAPAAPRF